MTDHERAIEVAARAARTLQFGKDEWDDLPEAIRIVWIGLAAETVKAYLAALGDGWQPMESADRAPIKGTRFGPWLQLHEPGKVPMPGRWWQDYSRGWWQTPAGPINPTAWRPLPAPPKEEKK